uniref:Elongation factor-like 1 n=1 Tax=Araucaria cunninghamii TaxID=56994 RepID=A0A0D6QUR7_ARACU
MEEVNPNPRKIRNICILAHVDHGKTTLADHLIAGAGAGLLHPKQAGKLRFMDYLDEEQKRAITMKSSAVALQFRGHTINLIDSPGHIDFCGEVSTAARLSDGAFVLVDVVEGVHIQTHAVLRQAWIEKVTPCLVLNKIDRLITELKLSPMEAYTRLQNIVHEVNNIISSYRSEKYLSDVDSIIMGAGESADIDKGFDTQEEDEEDAFQPQNGNVAFVCALDGWGFCIGQFADLYVAKLGASATALKKALWGNHYFIPKTKKIVGKKGASNKAKPMFVQFVLEPLWQVYESVLQGREGQVMLEKVIKSMNLTIPSRDLQHKDSKVVLQAVLSRWLPLSDTVLQMAVDCLPDPVLAQSNRISRLLPKQEVLSDANHEELLELDRARRAVETCDFSISVPCVAFVSKMFAIPVNMLPRKGPSGEVLDNLVEELGPGDTNAGHQEVFLAFARVFSGKISTGQKIFVLSSLYDPLKTESQQKHVQEATVQSLYMMMGRGLEPVATASAGNVIAIRGLGQHILKSATLSSTLYCWPFASMTYQAGPILRVAIEPSKPADMGALTKGLQLLNRADPFVEVTVSGRGEHVLAAAGEVHLERCIKDLKERFARVELEVSPPIVSYRETIEGDGIPFLDSSKNGLVSTDFVEKTTLNGKCVVRVQVMKLPSALTKVLDESSDLFQDIVEGKSGHGKTVSESLKKKYQGEQSGSEESEAIEDPVLMLRKRIIDAVETDMDNGSQDFGKKRNMEDRKTWLSLLQRIWALGPGRIGPNILLSADSPTLGGNVKAFSDVSNGNSLEVEPVLVHGSPQISEKLGLVEVAGEKSNETALFVKGGECGYDSLYMETKSLQSSIVSGFQLATAAGPLCEEPMWGLAFLVEAYMFPARSKSSDSSDVVGENGSRNDTQHPEQYGPLSGQVMTAVKEACRSAILLKKPRIVEAMYFCEVCTPTEYLGSMYAVLARRRARVLKEEMREGSDLFTVHAYVPVAESFGFADELRRWTSGAASPQLLLSHWEVLPQDPFFVPKTEEELEEFGDGSNVPPNTARKMIDSVRRRKGLPVEEKVVQHATKQRTLARKV